MPVNQLAVRESRITALARAERLAHHFSEGRAPAGRAGLARQPVEVQRTWSRMRTSVFPSCF
jgi:hypothetical protein